MTDLTLILDDDAQHHEWVRSFEWHLDVLAPLVDALVTATLPSIRATQFDKIRITGGGYLDNMQLLDVFDITTDGEFVATGAAADVTELWEWVAAYTRAVAEWITPTRPAPVLDDKPNGDPLAMRGTALLTAGWLIDHADQIETVHELNEHRDAMFALIRRLRGKYGVHEHPRRLRPAVCTTCGERAVRVDWIDNPTGAPKPIRAAVCKRCGETYTDHQEQTA